jgi:hypothetical protein
MDPQAPSQPPQQTGLDQSQNPVDKTTTEQALSQDTSSTASAIIDHRKEHDVPSQHAREATSTSLGYGDTGPFKEKDTLESQKMNYSKSEWEGEQMRPLGEGDVAAAVQGGGGGGHAGQDSLTADMGKKTQEHKEALHERGQRTARK